MIAQRKSARCPREVSRFDSCHVQLKEEETMAALILGFCAGVLTVCAIDAWGEAKDFRAFYLGAVAVVAFVIGFIAR